MAPATGGFFGMPWPNDIRVRDDGTLDLRGYPGRWHPLIDIILRSGARSTAGFGSNSPAFFTFTGPLDPASLPSPGESATAESPVLLVNVDPDSSGYGTRIPVSVEFDRSLSLYKTPNTLSVLPYPGFVLDEGTRYAVILLDGLRAQRAELEPASLLARLDEPWDVASGFSETDFEALRGQRDAVVDYLDAETPWTTDQMLAFTVFTTQRVTETMVAMHSAVEALPSPAIHAPQVVRDCTEAPVAAIDAELDMPRFQAGTPPYLQSGGEVVIGPDDVAVVQFFERLPFRAAVPCRAAPPQGWPIIVHIDGTGSRYTAALTHFADRFYPSGDLNHIVVSITPHMTEDRIPAGGSPLVDFLENLGLAGEELAYVYFFNFLNPIAGVNNQRQIGAEISYLKRVGRALDLPGVLIGAESDISTDDEQVAYYGHSHGSISAPLALAVDDEFDAALLSAGGAGFYHNLEHRGDVGPFIDRVLFLPRGELDEHHPVSAIVQTLAEGGDTANYADDIDSPHLLLTSGFGDGCTPRETSEHLAAAAGLPVADPKLWDVTAIESLLGTPTEPLPISANLPGGRTAALLQLDAGHFGVHANPGIVRTFFDSLAETGVPTITAGPFVPEVQTRCLRHE